MAISALAYFMVFSAPPDGLANMPLVLINVPLVILERLMTHLIYGSLNGYLWKPIIELIHLSSNYYWQQFFCFFPLTVANGSLWYWLGRFLQRKLI